MHIRYEYPQLLLTGVYTGGAYVDILNHEGKAVDVINVWDYKGGVEVDAETREARIQEYFGEIMQELLNS